ncbi:GHMP kinase [Candidatus Kryptonium thompsonii]|nr:GHMP kinase [Candidatus Kryptonium thompsoni]
MRISFAGGGTDVDPFPEEYGGVVVNASINKYVTSTLKFRRDQKIKIEIAGEGKIIYDSKDTLVYDGKFDAVKAVIKHMYKGERGLDIYIYKDVEPRSGLGGSAALFLSVIGLFNEISAKKLDKYECAELAYQLERNELKNLGGRQDQIVCAFGGINFIEFKGKDFVRVTPLNLSKETICELEERLILINLGARRNSGTILEQQIKNVETGKNIDALLETKKITYEIKDALLSGDLEKFGKLLDKAWELKKKFAEGISNPDIDRFYKRLKELGVIGGKISGAGGGGHMFVFCKSFCRHKIEREIEKFNYKVVPFSFENSGLVTWRSKMG